ncbi:MAG: phosphatidylinositol-specific phospholipase C/glycerophosphodiester phosphodiesterase family protein [Gemmata sp.]
MLVRSLLLLTALALAPARGDEPVKAAPLPRAHAHNDYQHPRPLLDALSHGFCSVEADIWLVGGELLVGHTPLALKKDRTLEKLYLAPLRERARANGGKVYRDGPPFFLMIDLKTGSADAHAALATVLEGYADLLTVTRDGKAETKAVTAVLSGSRDAKTVAGWKPRYASIDGRPSDLEGAAPADLIPWVSDSWKAHFKWNGVGAMPDDERKKLRDLVTRAHKQGRKVRFWAAPESEAVWKELLAAGVDLLNTDRLAEMETFLRAAR